jgi:hypothetical protein
MVVKTKSYYFQVLSLSPMEKVIKSSDGGWTLFAISCSTPPPPQKGRVCFYINFKQRGVGYHSEERKGII